MEVQAVIAQPKEMRGTDPRRRPKAVWFHGTSWGAGGTRMELGVECAGFVGSTQIGVEEALTHYSDRLLGSEGKTCAWLLD